MKKNSGSDDEVRAFSSTMNSTVPAPSYATASAAATAAPPSAALSSADTPGPGASSITFWCRRCTEQSRSPRWTADPRASASTCTSRWRGRATSLSRRSLSSPNDAAASRRAAPTAAGTSEASRAIFIPLPPPPRTALMSMGKPTRSASAQRLRERGERERGRGERGEREEGERVLKKNEVIVLVKKSEQGREDSPSLSRTKKKRKKVKNLSYRSSLWSSPW